MRRCLTQILIAAAMCLPLPAFAQQKPNCPPGSWFCAEADVQIPPILPPPAQPPAPPPAAEAPPAPPAPPPLQYAPPAPPPPPHPMPPVVVYQPVPVAPPPGVIIIAPGYGYGYGYGRPMPPPPTRRVQPQQAPFQSEWGLALRVEGATVGHPSGAGYSSGLGGVGMSLRFRPVPAFAFDFGADVLTGTDYNGFQRTEVPLSLSGMIFLNPRSRVQVYLLGGANYSRAEVRSDTSSPLLVPVGGGQYGETYTYFGGQGGLGLEFRLSKRAALDLDGLFFVRKRVGDIARPEFIDGATGETTDTSGGGLFRAGLTFWW